MVLLMVISNNSSPTNFDQKGIILDREMITTLLLLSGLLLECSLEITTVNPHPS